MVQLLLTHSITCLLAGMEGLFTIPRCSTQFYEKTVSFAVILREHME